jgi:hypothetical protein
MCTAQSCQLLPDRFKLTDRHALDSIRILHFNFKDKIIPIDDSWMLSANYYSCDLKKGYLIIACRMRIHLHAGVPIELWDKFKSANSFIGFYNDNIKGKYQFYY